jgi:hypothetical protein
MARQPTRELDVLEASRDLAEGIAVDLPCSAVIAEAISSLRALTRCRNSNITSVRDEIDEVPQVLSAARAVVIAPSISSGAANGTRAWTEPSAGS